jgi:hypothetical protein
MGILNLKPTHAPVKAYYETLEKFGRGKFDNEGNIRRAFESLLEKCARQFEWFVVPEYQISRSGKNPLRVDATVLDAFNLPRGYWEAKDVKDDLSIEMNKKFAEGYPRTNILFQAPTRAILVQNGRIEFDGDISDPAKLVDVLRLAMVQIASFPSDTVLIWGAGYGDEEWEGYEGIVCGSAFRS